VALLEVREGSVRGAELVSQEGSHIHCLGANRQKFTEAGEETGLGEGCATGLRCQTGEGRIDRMTGPTARTTHLSVV
jgi:hypothetical protein